MPGQRQIGGGKGSGGGMRTGGGSGKAGKPKSNVTKIGSKKPMSAAEQKARVKIDRIKKSPAAEDIRKGNLDNLRKTYGLSPQKPKVTRKNNSPFGPVAAGIVKPKPKPKPKGKK
jgi:hypothetical protein